MPSAGKSRRPSPRITVALAAAKAIGGVTRRLGRGGGTALPGLVAERIAPDLLRHVRHQFARGIVMVTGTNGKTTTTTMVAEIAREAGLDVTHNRSGSNLMRGLNATIAGAVALDGALDAPEKAVAVLEVDEAVLSHAAPALQPSVVTFLNLFRDQLDRYGEVDTVFARWRDVIARLPADATLVLNADDPTVAALGLDDGGHKVTFGIDDPSVALGEQEHASDARWCHVCGTEYDYDAVFAGHVGLWRCRGCGRQRQAPDVAATAVTLHGFDDVTLAVRTPEGELTLTSGLGGVYNVYNLLAALATAVAMEVPLDAATRALERFRPAFGRQERMVVDGKGVRILLGKNPAGLNQVLHLLASLPGRKHLLVILNDQVADGTDVSWIWDADYEQFADQLEHAVISGQRASEMAVRLKYGGWGDAWPVVLSIPDALDRALDATPAGGELYVIPTYTAMLEVRELLAKMAGEGHFWERRG